MHKYDKALNGSYVACEVCAVLWFNYQHHVYGRRYSDLCIWVCLFCHQKIHANPEWAYKHKYLIKHNSQKLNMEKNMEKKKKACSHAKSYFNSNRNAIICQFCGKEVESINFGTTKSPKKTIKMSNEEYNPQIKEAVRLKAVYDSLCIKISKEKNRNRLEILKEDQSKILSRMQELAHNNNTFDMSNI